MKRPWHALILLWVLASACTRPHYLPALTPIPSQDAANIQALFPNRPWQLVHEIQASLPQGSMGPLLGVLTIYPRACRMQCALMTLEGFVLFEAELGDTIDVRRAVPPFDKNGFSSGLRDDLSLLYCLPKGERIAFGRDASGDIVRRYRPDKRTTVDILTGQTDQFQIRLYRDEKLRKRIIATAAPQANEKEGYRPCPKTTLQSYGRQSYQLHLRLIQEAALSSTQ